MLREGTNNVEQALRLIEIFSSFEGLEEACANLKAKQESDRTESSQSREQFDKETFYDALENWTDSIDNGTNGINRDGWQESMQISQHGTDQDELEHTDTKSNNKYSQSPHNADVLELNALDPQARTLLSTAAAADNPKAIAALLHHGADANIADVAGWTPLHVAANEGNIEAARSLLGVNATSTDFLSQFALDLNLGANLSGVVGKIDPRDNIGRTPLTVAIRSQHTDIALLLLDRGANVDLRDYYGRSPIFHAIIYNNEAVIKSLFLRRCNAIFIASDGTTILHTAAIYATLPTLAALRNGIDEDYSGRLPLTTIRDEQGRTALECASQGSNYSNENPYDLTIFEDFLKTVDAKLKIQDKAEEFARMIKTIEALDIHSEPAAKPVKAVNVPSRFFLDVILLPVFLVDAVSEASPWEKSLGVREKIHRSCVLWLISMIWITLSLQVLGSSRLWKRTKAVLRRLTAKRLPPDQLRVHWICVSTNDASISVPRSSAVLYTYAILRRTR